MWKYGSESSARCKIFPYDIAKTTSQKSCNSLPSQKLYTITCIIPLFTSQLAAKVKTNKQKGWFVLFSLKQLCIFNLKLKKYEFHLKLWKTWPVLEPQLYPMWPLPGKLLCSPARGRACSWEALLRGVSVQEGSPALHLEAKRGHNPVVQSCSPSHQK